MPGDDDMRPHLDEQDTLDWLEGRLSAERLAAAERHVDACAECRRLLAEIARAVDDAPSAPEAPSIDGASALSGTSVGRYRVEELLGAGAMGWVYRAYDPQLGRAVALKLVRHPEVSAARVRREARTLARLNHPHVVTVLAAGDSEAGPWIAMELVEGWTLRQWVHACAPSPDDRADALRDAARGLVAVHAAGIVHGDLKPGNILVDRQGRVRVADFGLASTRAPEPLPSEPLGTAISGGDESTTVAGRGGTPIYMAPEVLRGEAPTGISDQFSFCVTAWELLAGQRPFVASTREALVAAIERGPPSPTVPLPPPFAAVLRRGLAVSPGSRFADMEQLLEALQARPRRRALTVGLAAGGVVLAAVVLTATTRGTEERCAAAASVHTLLLESQPGPALTESLVRAGRDPQTELRQLDRWLDAWSPARRSACIADEPKVERCLDDALASVEGRLVALAEGSVPDEGLLAEVREPEQCVSGVEEMTPPERSEQARRLRRQLSVLLGRYAHRADERGREALAELVEQADALGEPGLQASTRFRLAQMYDKLGKRDPARQQYERAYFHAMDADASDLAAQAAGTMAQVLGNEFADYDAAMTWIGHARAALPRSDVSHRRAEIELIHGELLQSLGRLDEAAVHLSAAESALPGDAKPRIRAAVQATIGQLAIAREDYPEAVSRLERAVELHEQRGRAGERELPRALNGLATAYIQLERFDDAAEQWSRALALTDESGRVVTRAILASNLGALRAMQGDHAAALEHYAVGCAAMEQAKGSTGPEISACHYNMALALDQLGRFDEAASAARRAIDAASMADPPLVGRTTGPLATLAHALAQTGDTTGALTAQRRRLQVYDGLLAQQPASASLIRKRIIAVLDLAEYELDASQLEPARARLASISGELSALDVDARARVESRLGALRSRAAAGRG